MVAGFKDDFEERVKRLVGRLICVRNVEKILLGVRTGIATVGLGCTGLIIMGSCERGDGTGVIRSLMYSDG